jgi:amidophosphoribosyltransferase
MEINGEKCAVFGVFGRQLDVSRLTFFGLFALQHRGQESSGIAVSNGNSLLCYKNMGLVTHVYNEETIQSLKGHIAIGHNRYSTSAGSHIKHAQPVMTQNGLLSLAHNGNLPSVTALKEFLEAKDIPTEDHSDSELMAKAISYYLDHGENIQEAVKKSWPLFTGAFSITMMTKDSLVAIRDEYGIRPLSLGKLDGGYVVASETCAFKTIGAEFIREINPGEMVIINDQGVESVKLGEAKTKVDIFEFVYFARPDSEILGKSVYQVRHNCGLQLAKEYPIEADIVIPVPETAMPVAIAYSKASGIPFETGLIKNRYIHRTFIQPEQHARELGVKMKLTPLTEVLTGKRVIVIDDSIVRGTTSKQIVKMIFEAGAKEVHFLISSPPVKFPDFYGIDTPDQQHLIGSHKTVDEIRDYLGATSLYFLSLKGLVEATGLPQEQFCLSCFNGEYPIDLKEKKVEVKEPQYAVQPKPADKLF